MSNTFEMSHSWKDFNVDLIAVDTHLKSAFGVCYLGNSASPSGISFIFDSEPIDEVKSQVIAYWNGIMSTSPEALSYRTAAQIKQEAVVAKASAMAKLAALGLSQDEISAIIGA